MRNEEILRANLKALSEALRNQRNPPKPTVKEQWHQGDKKFADADPKRGATSPLDGRAKGW
jgi:hypothetical protein